MDASTILHELTHAEGLPKEALEAATEQRTEMVPLFLRETEDYLAATGDSRAKPTPLFFVFHLLGEWRETSAYGPLLRLLRCPRHETDAVLGDAVTSTSHRVIAAVFDGELDPLFDAILDPEADEFIRSRMCEALAMVVLRGEANRDLAAHFLRDGFMNIQPQAVNFVWHGWQSAIAMLGLRDLSGLVEKTFNRGYIDRQWLGFEHFKEDLEHGAERAEDIPQEEVDPEFSLFGKTIEELSTWYEFTEKYREDRERSRRAATYELPSGNQPFANPFRGVGRNDPCPCGSGKKFKHCCLQ